MSINFNQKNLGTTVISRQISADGYDANNLVETCSNNRGFRVEYYIKPPIEIIFTFKCPINMAAIIINTTCGSHHVEALELYVSYKSNALDLIDYTNVAKCFGLKSPTIILENHRYQGRKIYSCMSGEKISFKSTNWLSNIGSLKICILRMKNSGVPGLKSVEIWGKPSRSTDEAMVASFFTPNTSSIQTPLVIPTEMKKTKTIQDISLNSESVPEEFLDSITYNIMTIPMLLPSGRSIDKTSLDKLYETGRQPFDPFTGLPFSEQRKPLPNNSLKLRIDSFLSKQSAEGDTQCYPRIVGTTQSNSLATQSRLLPNPIQTTVQTLKRPLEDEVQYIRTKKTTREPVNHEEELAFSLDEAVASILTDKKRDKIPGSADTLNVCSICKLKTFQMYALSCKHLLCKNCVKTLKFPNSSEKCPQCQNVFNHYEITLIHVK